MKYIQPMFIYLFLLFIFLVVTSLVNKLLVNILTEMGTWRTVISKTILLLLCLCKKELIGFTNHTTIQFL